MQQPGITSSPIGKKLRKGILGRTWKPAVQYYLRRSREYVYKGLSVIVHPGIFHPGLFHSTRVLLKYLGTQELAGKTFLELGCGSGLISVFGAKQGAKVIAADINKKALENTLENALRNGVDLDVIHSDLFVQIPVQVYDYIMINPPYYPGNAVNDESHAWYCGADHEYFQKLFEQLQRYTNAESKAIMVLSEDCNFDKIGRLAERAGFLLHEIDRKYVLFEWNFLFRIVPIGV